MLRNVKQRIRIRVKTYLRPDRFSIMLLFVAIATYGVMSLWLGFYWDDLSKLLVADHVGLDGYSNFAAHRPLNGYWYILFFSILGKSSLGWQLLAIFFHWTAALTFWKVLSLLWPNQGYFSATAALLFLVFPGFGQSNIGLTYYVHFLALTLFFTSIWLMIKAQHSSANAKFYTLAALTASIISMMTTDYFYGLELIRPIPLHPRCLH